MTRTTNGGRRWGRVLLGLVLLVGLIGGGWLALKAMEPHPAYLDLPRAATVRKDLHPTLGIGGDLDSAEKTLVRCELESLGAGGGGSALILDLVADGAVVEKGRVIAQLDSSEYEERARQYEILVLQAHADEQKGRLDLQSAEIGLKEYRDGQLAQIREDLRSQIVLHEADIQRQKDRLVWAESMVVSGYVSEGQLLDEQAALQRSEVNAARVRGELAKLNDYSSNTQIKRLEAAVARAQEELSFQQLQVVNREDQLARLHEQVEACTIRAPHAGMVNYVTKWDPNAQLVPGARVYKDMVLFYFPNLERMEVQIELHESMITRVRPGQKARIQVTAMPDLVLDGRIDSIDVLPQEPRNWMLSDEIRNFLVHVAVDSPPPGLYPGMSASVDLDCDPRPGALVVPSTALTMEEGAEVVYVVGHDGLERRLVDSAPGDLRVVEILSGLAEGEEVILDPHQLDPEDVLAARTTEGSAFGPGVSWSRGGSTDNATR